ncbi:MAG: hypothetical protein ACM3JE_01945 [Betaproteobacteria bacterium]
MYALNQAESSEHQRLVRALIDQINRAGFEVTNASVDGYPPCPEIEGQIPDVRASNLHQLIAIGEAKTPDDLDNEQTDNKLRLFSNLTVGSGISNGATIPFYIATTKGNENQVLAALTRLCISERTNIHIIGL